ncbi:hypothetical protein LP414_09515 [Polaromonas sp. P1(28)-13]|nr:hypothetical protein LP414_09515 [Polaromonas sp. P1(28)-13]
MRPVHQSESADEGYELKAEQVALALEPLGLQNLGVGFYNANEDPATLAQEFLVKRLALARGLSALASRTQRTALAHCCATMVRNASVQFSETPVKPCTRGRP